MKSQLLGLEYSFLRLLLAGLFTIIGLSAVNCQVVSDSHLSKTVIYADAGVHFGSQVSANIEFQIANGDKVTWYGRGGVGFAGVIMATGGPGVLGGVSMLTGRQNKYFELNGGAFVGKDVERDEVFVLPLVDVGYRYQKPEGGFVFKAKIGILGVGIGLGYAF